MTKITVMDLKHLKVRVKHTNIASSAKALYLYAKALKALQMRSSQEAMELLNKSKKRFMIALRSDPNNPDLLRGIALVHYKLTEFHQLQGRNMANVTFSPYDPNVVTTDLFFRRALSAQPDDPNTLHHYARFKIRCDEFDTAEQMFLQALQIDPNNREILRAYGFFLSELGEVCLLAPCLSNPLSLMV
jgi:Tfp pilus assembly protein PilF